jgi:glycosyltransferase involved in cell wall biosynthesis
VAFLSTRFNFHRLMGRRKKILRASRLGRWLADATRPGRSAELLRRSGLFDYDFYRSQLTEPVSGSTDLIKHYLAEGSTLGLSPHPLFDPEFYLAHTEQARRSPADPFIEFLINGAKRLDDPHPLFDVKAFARLVPQATSHRFGPFGHFHGSDEPWPLPEAMRDRLTPANGYAAYVEVVTSAMASHLSVPDYTSMPRVFTDFDHRAASAFIARMKGIVSNTTDPPTVSIILPTMNRSDRLKEAIKSVQDQSYDHWELIVVDDGGTDDTGELVGRMAAVDGRIKYVWQENTGVSGARNRGLEMCTGEYVGFLDSDNTWVPEFLETMIGFLSEHHRRAAYSSSELTGRNTPFYRGRPFSRGALLQQNYIDCITIVVERALLLEIGGFDGRLRRVGDWDLLIRLSEVAEPAHAPFVGTSYQHWNTDATDRITSTETPGFRQVVIDKHLRSLAVAPTVAERTSGIMVVSEPASFSIDSAIDLVMELSEADDHELILIDNGLNRENAIRLRLLEQMVKSAIVERFPEAVAEPVALNRAASLASGDVLVIVDPLIRISGRSIEEMAKTIRLNGPALAQPVIVDNAGTIHSAGQILGRRGSVVVWGHGAAFEDPLMDERPTVDGPEGICFAVDSSLYRQVKGMNPIYLKGSSDIDLGIRAQARGASTFVVSKAIARITTTTTPNGIWSPIEADRAEFRKRWRTLPGMSLPEDSDSSAIVALQPIPSQAPLDPMRWAPVVSRNPPRKRWAIKTSVPDLGVAPTWGDWHFARDLKLALERLGKEVVVDAAKAWRRSTAVSDDINLVLRGTRRYLPNPGQINILWVISHPERLTFDELSDYELVFVASEVFPKKAKSSWKNITFHSLLQCTDPSRFYFEPDSSLDLDVLFVGNSRNVMRPSVEEAINLNLDLSVYGTGWDGLIPPEYIKGEYVPNEDLNRYYSSAQIVLNDHWDDMRDNGFISNRIFDAVASGAVVVSDHIPGIERYFDDRVITFRDLDEFPAAIERARSIGEDRTKGSATISAHHTFDVRAQELVRAVDGLIGTN